MTRTALVWLVGSLVALAPLAACSDDSGDDGTGGSGTGNSGAGASSTGGAGAGGTGTGGTGTGGTGAGGTGTGGSGGVAPLEVEFLIVDDDGRVLGYEVDDGSLTDIPLGFDLEWYAMGIVAAGNGAFMAVGGQYNNSNSAAAVYSPDGVTWTDVSPAEAAAPYAWRNIAYGNGNYVATCGEVFHSGDDGATWTEVVSAPNTDDVAFGDGRFVASDGSHSTDGLTWTAPSTPPPNLSQGVVAFGAGRFVILGDPSGGDEPAHYSDDGGVTWVEASMTQHYVGFDAATFGDGRFVASDSYLMVYSDDGATWSDGTAPDSNLDMAQIGVAFHPTAGFLRVAGQYGQGEIWESADGMTWTGVGGTLGGYWLTDVAATQ